MYYELNNKLLKIILWISRKIILKAKANINIYIKSRSFPIQFPIAKILPSIQMHVSAPHSNSCCFHCKKLEKGKAISNNFSFLHASLMWEEYIIGYMLLLILLVHHISLLVLTFCSFLLLSYGWEKNLKWFYYWNISECLTQLIKWSLSP